MGGVRMFEYKGAITSDMTYAAQNLRPGEAIQFFDFGSFKELRDFSKKMPKMWHRQEHTSYRERAHYFPHLSYTITNTGTFTRH